MKIIDLLDKIKAEAPDAVLNEDEFNNILINFGSFLSIVKNKRINQTSLVSSLLDDKNIRNLFIQMVEVNNFNSILQILFKNNPNLIRSKTIKNKYKKYLKLCKNESSRKNNI